MANQTSTNTLSVFSLLEVLRRRKYIIAIPTILLTAGFAAYAWYQPDVYRAEAVLAAEHVTPPEYLRHISAAPLNIQDHLWTVREVVFSTPVLTGAAKGLVSPSEVGGIEGDDVPDDVIESVKSRIGIRVDGEHTFAVSFQGGDPREVADVTNRLAKLFISRATAQRGQKTQDTANVIDQQLAQLQERLSQQDQEVRSYKLSAAHELPEHVDGNIRALETAQSAYNAMTSRIEDEAALKSSIMQEMRELEDRGARENVMIAEKTPEEVRLENQRMKLKEMETRYTPVHPEVVQTKREIADLEAMVKAQPKRSAPSGMYLRYLELESELERIDQRIAAYRREQQALSSQIAVYRRRVEAAPRHERALDALTREMVVGESQLHALLDKQLDATMAASLEKSDTGIAFSIVQPASVPGAPFSPHRERLLLMGLFAGLGLGIGLAFLMEQHDTSFATVDDFQSFTSLPLAGVIPSVTRDANPALPDLVVTQTDPDSVAAEQYRLLAMKVQQQSAATQAKVIMITSAVGGEGKSMTAINLANALRNASGRPVLLVDADMRKPRIHEYLRLPSPAGGGFHSLLQTRSTDAAPFVVDAGGLKVIPGSTPSSNPIAALSSSTTKALFERLREQFEYVIVDAPPTLPVADGHILGGLADMVLFVVRARKTPRELLQHAVDGFKNSNVMGAVLTDVDYQRSRYAYAYEYYKKSA